MISIQKHFNEDASADISLEMYTVVHKYISAVAT